LKFIAETDLYGADVVKIQTVNLCILVCGKCFR
jgi:hypothetical protein